MILQIAQVQHYMILVFHSGMLARGIWARLNFKSHDVEFIGIGNRLGLNYKDPVVVENIPITYFLTKRNSVMIPYLFAGDRVSYNPFRRQIIDVQPVSNMRVDFLLDVFILFSREDSGARPCILFLKADLVFEECFL